MKLKDKIKQYIKKNSTATVRNRAKNIKLKVTKETNKNYFFKYQGSGIFPYAISAKIVDETIETYCSCPYDYEGICKHQVAALNYVLKKNKQILEAEVDDKIEIKDRNSKIWNKHLPNHIITNDILYHSLYVDLYWVEILEINVETKFVKTIYERNRFYQTFNYDTEKRILTAECSCKQKKSKCAHIVAGLVLIYNEFGANFFDPNYKDELISDYLKQYGLTLQDDYEKYFSFSFKSGGIEVVEKAKNLCSIDFLKESNVFEKLDEKTKDSLSLLEAFPKNETTETHGIGFCFEFENHSGYDEYGDYHDDEVDFYDVNFIPFIGKYKKNTTELATRFSPVDDGYNLLKKLENRTETEKVVLLEAVSLVDLYDSLNRNNIEINTLKKIFVKTKEFIDKHKDKYSFFVKDSSTTLVKKNLKQLEFSDQPAELFFTVKEDENLVSINPKIKIKNTYKLDSKKLRITPAFCIKDNKTVHLFKSPKDYFYIYELDAEGTLQFIPKDKEKVVRDFIAPISEHFYIENNICEIEKLPENTNIKKQVFLADYEGEYITFKLGMEYGDRLILMHTNEQIITGNKIIRRNENLEDEFIEEFKELHPDFKEQEGIFYLRPTQLIQGEWLLKASQKLKHKNVEIFGVKDLKSFKYNLNEPTISMSVKSNIDWFDLDMQVSFGKEKVSLKDIRKAMINKSKYIQLKDGTLGVFPEKWIEKFAKYFKAGEVKDKSIKISNYQFNIIDDLYDDLQKKPDFLVELQQKKENLQNLKNIKPVKLPKTVKAELRPYQQEGLNWLICLLENNLGGCLADDMGLGKTLQTIALLAYIKQKKLSKLPSLIIAPTSLIFNWNKEFEKFAPTIKIMTYIGTKRDEMFNKIKSQDIIITTYGTVLNDIVKLQNQTFFYVILDESQAIKNPNSKRYKSVRLLKADNRLTLTGTPIENNTFDLFSQMNFLNPGLLGSMSHFKTEFSDAIDKSHNKEASELLYQIIYPFLLRRTKNQVATDLPQKTESIIYCEMGREQRKIYEAFKDKYRDFLLDKFKENGEAKSQMYVLEGLTKLRQICNSPQLLNDEEEYSNSSVKLDILLENIKTITSEGSKMLVFSQFTSMLALVQERLNEENIIFEYLDGQTRNREEKVKNFQENNDVSVFLISLKAGGTGLNLTKAEYVFLIDPWWNPAVENQAIDRCYRIGQTKNVIAYKMICKDTIEEKIVDLQENKKDVSDSIIQIDKKSKSFDKARIKELFG